MRIKVIKSNNPCYWYADKIGQEFEILDTSEMKYTRKDIRYYYLNMDDCEVIQDIDCEYSPNCIGITNNDCSHYECACFKQKKTMRDISLPELVKKAEEFTEMIKDGTIKNRRTTLYKDLKYDSSKVQKGIDKALNINPIKEQYLLWLKSNEVLKCDQYYVRSYVDYLEHDKENLIKILDKIVSKYPIEYNNVENIYNLKRAKEMLNIYKRGSSMKEEGLMGGGRHICEECGETVFGSAIHYCEKDKIKIETPKDSTVEWEDPIAELGKKDRKNELIQAFLKLHGSISGKTNITMQDVIKEYMDNNPTDPIFDEVLNEMEGKERVSEKKEIKSYITLSELKQFVDKYMKEGYQDVPVYFDTEGRSFGCHMIKIKGIHTIPEEAMREKYVVLTMDMNSVIEETSKPQFAEEQFENFMSDLGIASVIREEVKFNAKLQGYIIPVKSEEPLIVHNVLSWKGKNYLKQPFIDSSDHCSGCYFEKDECCRDWEYECNDNYIWKSFDDIQITDELACMRKDIGDIYITYKVKLITIEIFKLMGTNGDICLIQDGRTPCPVNAFELATAEELQEYFKDKK